MGSVPASGRAARGPEATDPGSCGGRAAGGGCGSLYQAAESGYPLDKKKRLETLEDAWRMAGLAKQAMPPLLAVTGLQSETDASRALNSPRLDSLTLRVRTIRAMLRLDRKTALDRLIEFPLPAPPPAPCESVLTGDPSPFFQLLVDVGDIERLTIEVGSLTAPEQLQPALKAVFDIKTSTEHRALMATRWGSAVNGIRASFRSFCASSGRFYNELAAMAEKTKETSDSYSAAVEALRTYENRHWSGEVCADRANAPQAKKARSIGAAPVNPGYGQSPYARKLREEFVALRYGTAEQQAENAKRPRREDGLPHHLPDAVRRSPEWESAMRKHLVALEEWKPDETESQRSWFHQRAMSYNSLLDTIPDGPLRRFAVQSYISFLKGSDMRQESPSEWLLAIGELLGPSSDDKQALVSVIETEVRRDGDGLMNLILDAREV
jgi:hypothetical protein